MPHSFAAQYKKLNPAQKLAVDTIEGPVMVLAGPGTGKTHILTLRIANILAKTDTKPDNILALTFTDSAARTMRSRLVALIGTPGYRVRIETFHALCDGLIREYPEYFPFARDAAPLSQIEQFTIIRDLLDNPHLKYLRTPSSKYHYTKDIITSISTLKRENVSPTDFAKVVQDEQAWFENEKDTLKKIELLKWESLLGKHQELVPIYLGYETAVRKMARYDFDDMLLKTHQALTTQPLLLASLQEQFQYILVDEYQDTNGVQNAIIDTLAAFWGDDANLFVVGDPNQTIFRFQGAILENTLSFLERYPKATIVSLTTGYRSNQQVYTSAHRLLAPILATISDHPLTQALSVPQSATHTRGSIEITKLANDVDEQLHLVEKIRSLLESDVKADEIAVLFRKNREGEILSSLFARAGLPFSSERDRDVLTNPLLTQFFTLLQMLAKLKEKTEFRTLFDVLGYSWFTLRMAPLARLQLIRSYATQKTQVAPYDFLMATENISLHPIGTTLADWVSQETKQTFPAFIELVARESGFLSYIHADSEALQDFIVLLREINSLARGQHTYRLTNFLLYLSTMSSEQLSLSLTGTQFTKKITLTTIHKAKGREWQHVFLPFFVEGYWGNARSKSGLTLPEGLVKHVINSDVDHDERRLLFVALTRAKESLHISLAQSKQENGKTNELLVSPYLAELPNISVPGESQVDPRLQELFITPPAPDFYDAETRAWLTTLTTTFKLSASSLNSYLEDPHQFFERYILDIPEAPQPHLAFGTAIHAALEAYFRHYNLNQALAVFDNELNRQVMTADDLAVRQKQGREILTAYLLGQPTKPPVIMALEESFGWRRGKIMLGDIELTGKIDRIDVVDKTNRTLRVIDYKTGKPKTMGEIEGTTKSLGLSARELLLPENIRGRLKRQLLFYKLLLALDPKYRTFQISEGIFEFVEPQKGKFISRPVLLADQDVTDLKALIVEVMAEIRTLKFLEP